MRNPQTGDRVTFECINDGNSIRFIEMQGVRAYTDDEIQAIKDKARKEVIKEAREWLTQNADKFYMPASQADDCFYDDDQMREALIKHLES